MMLLSDRAICRELAIKCMGRTNVLPATRLQALRVPKKSPTNLEPPTSPLRLRNTTPPPSSTTKSVNMATTAPPTLPPNQSLYIQNLNEKLQKDDLRRELYMLFSTYGPVLDITALKTKAMRGQAHVLFRDVGAATQAMRAQNGEEFFGREMVRLSLQWLCARPTRA